MQPFPGPGGKWQVSSQGGRDPQWRRDGKELFFLSPSGAMMSVNVASGTTLQLGTPRVLFPSVATLPNPTGRNYAVFADGQRFLIRKSLQARELPATTVFMNWTAGFAKRSNAMTAGTLASLTTRLPKSAVSTPPSHTATLTVA